MNQDIVNDLADLSKDPLAFVYWAFPWGEGLLENQKGPEEWQKKVLKHIGANVSPNKVVQESVASGHGIGKAQRLTDIIYTPEGVKTWGDLKPGDYVFDHNGHPTKILQTHHYKNIPMYRVTFDDRTYLDVSGGHLWTLKGRKQRRSHKGWITLSTEDILKEGVKRPNGKTNARQWEIPRQKPAEFQSRPIPLAPYFLGVWLGDGCRNSSRYTKPDDEVKNKIKTLGYDITEGRDNTVYIRNIKHLFPKSLLNCHSYERFIPDEYKFNTIETRKEILSGLLDTDGEINANHSIIYNTTSKALAQDVLWLARSLGGKASLQPTQKAGIYQKDGTKKICHPCWRITITLNFNPFTIERKRQRYHPVEDRYMKRWIDRIEPIGNHDAMCITVDTPEGLYQAKDFIVTHNSALVSWLILWAISTHENTRGVVTANTETQLLTKTWPELMKWHAMFLARNLFKVTATSIFAAEEGKEKNWRIDAIPWSVSNPEAFAGLHNQGNRTILIFDEASAIDDKIWEVAEGAINDANTERLWCAFGNPTRNTGRFYDCFHKFRPYWNTLQVDSRTVRFSDKTKIAQWEEAYGADSDFFKVRVTGEFPDASELQFISLGLVKESIGRTLRQEQFNFAPAVIGVDPAWSGGDATSIYLRQGIYSKKLARIQKNTNDLAIANLVARFEDKYHAAAVNIDLGYGTGIYSAGQTMGRAWNLISFAGSSPDPSCVNMRAYMWMAMKKWFQTGGVIENDQVLIDDLTHVEIKPTMDGRIQLKSKDEMKKQGIPSPNDADALALTFAIHVARKTEKRMTANTDYTIL